jgi:hypothetical protein
MDIFSRELIYLKTKKNNLLKMNIYFTKTQKKMNPEIIEWNDMIGMSNSLLDLNLTYQYSKGYLEFEKIPIKNIFHKVKFYIAKNIIAKFTWEDFIPIYVEKVILDNISLIEFPPKENFYMLQILEIKNSNVKYFPWKNIPNYLKSLNLSYNKLAGKINLSNTKQLRFIDLSHNSIESIDLPYDAHTVNLSYNKIKLIDFYNPLMYADFSWNCLVEFTGSKWLEKCNISHNSIKQFNISSSQKIYDINCSYNLIEDTVDFKNNKFLSKINFSNNKISNVEGLESLSSLEFCDFSFNLIETMIIPFISKISVNNNPLQYFEFINRPKTTGFSFTDFINGESSSNPIVGMVSNFLQDKLKMNRIDENNNNNLKNKNEIEKFYLDLSNLEIQEFPVDYNYNQGIIHIYFYNNDFIEIPYHPNFHIHLGRRQYYNWLNDCKDNLYSIKLNQLEMQKFLIIDSE